MIGENGPPLKDWQLPPRYHCGEWHHDFACPVCQQAPTIPPNVHLGEN